MCCFKLHDGLQLNTEKNRRMKWFGGTVSKKNRNFERGGLTQYQGKWSPSNHTVIYEKHFAHSDFKDERSDKNSSRKRKTGKFC